MAAKKSPKSNPAKAKKPAKKPRTAKATSTRVNKAKLKARRVAEEFVASGGNKARAARAAGSKAKNATQAANEILKKPEVQAEVEQVLAEARTDRIMTAREVLERLTEQAAFDITEYQNEDGTIDLAKVKQDRKGHCLAGYGSSFNQITQTLHVKGFPHSTQKALFKLADIYGLPQQPRSNEFEAVRKSVAEYAAKAQCTLAEAINKLKDAYPIVRKYEAQLLESNLT